MTRKEDLALEENQAAENTPMATTDTATVENPAESAEEVTTRSTSANEEDEPLSFDEFLNKLSPRVADQIKSEQNFLKAVFSGVLAGLIGAAIWAAITVTTEYQIGYMAIAVGALVGISMRYTGKGLGQHFGIAGAVIALMSCLLGNVFSILGFVANQESISFFNVLMMFNYEQLIPIMKESFSPIDLLFYGIAAYEGYKFAFRTFSQEEVQQLSERA